MAGPRGPAGLLGWRKPNGPALSRAVPQPKVEDNHQ